MRKYVSEETIKRRRKQKVRKRNLRVATLFLFLGVVIYAGYYLVTNVFSSDEKEEVEIIEPTKYSILQTNTSVSLLNEGELPTLNLNYSSFDMRMVQVEESDMVPLSYFDDAVFVGDSLADGFRVYKDSTGIVNATTVTARSISPKSFLDGGYIGAYNAAGVTEQVVGFEAIAAANPGKIYVTLGTNALTSSMSIEEFIASYYQFIDELRLYLPETQIYVTSVPPVTAYTVDEKPGLAPERVYYANVEIAKMCYEKDLAFINLYEVLVSDSGYLREDIDASDGIHLTPSGYSEWANYLRTHTVYNTSNPALVQ